MESSVERMLGRTVRPSAILTHSGVVHENSHINAYETASSGNGISALEAITEHRRQADQICKITVVV
jgi:hypothetical protein